MQKIDNLPIALQLMNQIWMLRQFFQGMDECRDLEVAYSIVPKMELVMVLDKLEKSFFNMIHQLDLGKSSDELTRKILTEMEVPKNVELTTRIFASKHNLNYMGEKLERMALEHEIIFGPAQRNHISALVQYLQTIHFQTKI